MQPGLGPLIHTLPFPHLLVHAQHRPAAKISMVSETPSQKWASQEVDKGGLYCVRIAENVGETKMLEFPIGDIIFLQLHTKLQKQPPGKQLRAFTLEKLTPKGLKWGEKQGKWGAAGMRPEDKGMRDAAFFGTKLSEKRLLKTTLTSIEKI